MKIRLAAIYPLVVSLAALVLFSPPSACHAEGKMSGIANERLEQILAADEFQPRRQAEGWSETLRAGVISFIERFYRKLRDWFNSGVEYCKRRSQENSLLSRLFRLLAGFFNAVAALAQVLGAVLVIGVLAVGIVLIARYQRRLARSTISSEHPTPGLQEKQPPAALLDELHACKKFRELLVALRQALRSALEARYGLSTAITDRYLMRQVSAEDRDRTVFAAVAEIFENTAFAGQPCLDRDIERIYLEYVSQKS